MNETIEKGQVFAATGLPWQQLLDNVKIALLYKLKLCYMKGSADKRVASLDDFFKYTDEVVTNIAMPDGVLDKIFELSYIDDSEFYKKILHGAFNNGRRYLITYLKSKIPPDVLFDVFFNCHHMISSTNPRHRLHCLNDFIKTNKFEEKHTEKLARLIKTINDDNSHNEKKSMGIENYEKIKEEYLKYHRELLEIRNSLGWKPDIKKQKLNEHTKLLISPTPNDDIECETLSEYTSESSEYKEVISKCPYYDASNDSYKEPPYPNPEFVKCFKTDVIVKNRLIILFILIGGETRIVCYDNYNLNEWLDFQQSKELTASDPVTGEFLNQNCVSFIRCSIK